MFSLIIDEPNTKNTFEKKKIDPVWSFKMQTQPNQENYKDMTESCIVKILTAYLDALTRLIYALSKATSMMRPVHSFSSQQVQLSPEGFIDSDFICHSQPVF